MTPFGFRVVCFEPLACNIIQALNILFINIFLNSPYSERGGGLFCSAWKFCVTCQSSIYRLLKQNGDYIKESWNGTSDSSFS